MALTGQTAHILTDQAITYVIIKIDARKSRQSTVESGFYPSEEMLV